MIVIDIMETIKGKNILVIGATGGIGKNVVKLLCASGANLFITGRNENLLLDIAAENKIAIHSTFVGDLTNAEQVKQLHQKYFTTFNTIDVMINASGIGIIKSMENLSEDDFMKTLMINLFSPFMLIKAFLPSMKEAKKGLIIHIPGVLGKVPMAGAAAYSASKYGLTGMMQSIREEIKRTDIRITNIFMGGVDSAFWDNIDLRVQRDKMINSEEAAKAIWFLCQQPASGVISEMVLQPFNHQAI
jgi:short-subunit dehydrogenase